MADAIGDSTQHTVREWCEFAHPVYVLYGWELYNSRTGKMEIPSVEILEEVCWDLLKQLDRSGVNFCGAARIGATMVNGQKELCLFPKVPVDGKPKDV